MAEQGFENRQDFEMELWPELRERWNTFLKFVFAGREADKELKQLVFLASSMASGCLFWTLFFWGSRGFLGEGGRHARPRPRARDGRRGDLRRGRGDGPW